MPNRPRHLAFVWFVALLALAFGGGREAVAAPPERQFWMGEILMPDASCPRVAFVVKLSRGENAAEWDGSLSIPRGCGIMGVIDQPLKSIVVTDERIAFVTPQDHSENAYEVVRVPGESVAKGTLLISGQRVQIRMWPVTEEEARNAAPRRPQMPTGDLPYATKEVRIPTSSADVELAGTLSIPAGAGPFAAVVLVTDAEAQDRDHTEGTHRPYLVLADQLTRAGYAVLRCDDRGLGGSGGSNTDSTLEETAQDVLSQVQFLSRQEGIDPGRIGVIGRGEGAQVAAMVAATPGSGVAFLVLLNASGHNGIDAACLRERHQLEAMGEEEEYINGRVERLRRALTLAAEPGKERELNEALREDALAYVSAVRGMGLKMTPDQVAMWASSRADAMTRRRFRSWLTTEPAEALRAVSCPVLVLHGALDLMNPPAGEQPMIEAALRASASKVVEVKTLPRVNHWLQPCMTGFDTEVDSIETTVSEDVIREIVAFLERVTKP